MTPANPSASEDARKVLSYIAGLADRPDKRVICGQQICCGWDLAAAYGTYIAALYQETGQYPALLGADLSYGVWSDSGQNSTLIEHWNNGGLITLCWTAWNPWTGNGLEWTGGTAGDRNIGDLADLYTPGNAAFDMWRADMDRKAEWLDQLQSAGVVVLWRPFHEMNGCWFWWCCRDRTKFVNLWRDMFDYFTNTKGLNNLLWVYAPSMSCGAAAYSAEYYYPGDDYVDIVGLDYYLTGSVDLEQINQCGRPELLALGKPFALAEFGPTGWYAGCGPPQHSPAEDCYDYGSLMGKIRALCPEVVYILAWGENYSLLRQRGAQELLGDSWVITRDEVDWRSRMRITRLATWQRAEQGPALIVETEGRRAEVLHADLATFDTAARIKVEAERQVGLTLPVFVHVNRDGSLAVAAGQEPATWPEDEPVSEPPRIK